MAEIQYMENDTGRATAYFGETEYIMFTVNVTNGKFSCVWTPSLPPLTALKKFEQLGLIPTGARGHAKLAHQEFETQGWQEAVRRVAALKEPRIHFLRLGTSIQTVAIQAPDVEGYGLSCAIGGLGTIFNKLGTALTLTASPSLILPYRAMHSRLVGSLHRDIEVDES